MNASQLRPGVYRVRHTDRLGSCDFGLSVIESCGLIGVHGFIEKPPRRGKHLTLTPLVREWIGRMEILP